MNETESHMNMPEFSIPISEDAEPGEKLRELLNIYESLKDQMDALQAQKQVLRDRITETMYEGDVRDTEVPMKSGRAFKVTLTARIIETVTREGKSFIKVHATPELLDSLIKTSEKDVLGIRELTGVPKQALFNRLHEDDGTDSEDS